MKNLFSIGYLWIFTFNLLLSTTFAIAQDNATANLADANTSTISKSIFDKLEASAAIKVTLESNFAKLIDEKNEDKYQPAIFSFTDEDGTEFRKAVKIKARGRFRRKVCDFPPLKIKFREDDLTGEGLNPEHKTYKLVSHCMEEESESESVLKEYLAYKLFNELTPKSFRVKLLEITYLDADVSKKPMVRYAFLIENTKEMAMRLNGEEIEEYNVDLSVMESSDRQVLGMFQFMIGNTDWKPKMMHNIKIVKSARDNRIMMIPYDFDFAGMVKTSYARPNPDYKQVSVEQRIFMDKVENLEHLEEMIRYFKKQKEPLFNVVKNLELLDKKSKREVMQYLKSFFNILNNPASCAEAFVGENL